MKKVPLPPKEQAEKFYLHVGKLTLIHAGIEQDLKGVLIEDWKIPELQVEKLYGKNLRKEFLKIINKCPISKNDYENYSKIIDRFRDASEQRNDIIKSTYGYLETDKQIFRYDLKIQRTFRPDMRFNNGNKKDWMKIVTFEDLQNLLDELGQIREGFFQLSRRIYLEKSL